MDSSVPSSSPSVDTITRLLVANRGEIACRVVRTCHRLGISSVSVFSDADAGTMATRLAHEAVHIGPPQPALSYLDGKRMIAAAKVTRAQAM